MDFGKWLKDRMNERSITREILAEKSGVSERSISYYMNGTRMPSLDAFLNILEGLKIDMILKERGQDK